MKKSIIDELNIEKFNHGQIIERDKTFYIVMDRLLHKFPNKEIIEEYAQESEDKFYDKFLMYFQHERPHLEKHSLIIGDEHWVFLIKIPYKMIKHRDKYLIKDHNISIKHDEILDIYYFMIETKTHYYRIYDFMEADYEIFEDLPFSFIDKYNYIEGEQYVKKTGYTLKTFCEKILKNKEQDWKYNTL